MMFTPVLLIILTATVTPPFFCHILQYTFVHPRWSHQSLLCVSVSARLGLCTIDVCLVTVLDLAVNVRTADVFPGPPFYCFEIQGCQQSCFVLLKAVRWRCAAWSMWWWMVHVMLTPKLEVSCECYRNLTVMFLNWTESRDVSWLMKWKHIILLWWNTILWKCSKHCFFFFVRKI